MSEEQIWQMRGLYSQLSQLQADVVRILSDRRINPKRVRDFKLSLQHLGERIDDIAGAS